jgi:hypothetical protein
VLKTAQVQWPTRFACDGSVQRVGVSARLGSELHVAPVSGHGNCEVKNAGRESPLREGGDAA